MFYWWIAFIFGILLYFVWFWYYDYLDFHVYFRFLFYILIGFYYYWFLLIIMWWPFIYIFAFLGYLIFYSLRSLTYSCFFLKFMKFWEFWFYFASLDLIFVILSSLPFYFDLTLYCFVMIFLFLLHRVTWA